MTEDPAQLDPARRMTDPAQLSRREAIRRVTALLGGAAFVSATGGLLAAHAKTAQAVQSAIGAFTLEDVAYLDEIAETILPQTDTPGAKAAGTGAFMALMVTDSFRPDEQRVFHEGMREVDAASRKAYGVSFMAATPSQRTAVLTALDHEQQRVMEARGAADAEPAHFFRMMKQLALLGFFTSEIGCTQALRYVESPGRFDACIPYAAGEPAWASHA